MYLKEKSLPEEKKIIIRNLHLKLDDIHELAKDIIANIRQNHYYSKSSYVLQINEDMIIDSIYKGRSWLNIMPKKRICITGLRGNISCKEATCFELIQMICSRVQQMLVELISANAYVEDAYDSVVNLFFKKMLQFFLMFSKKFVENFGQADDIIFDEFDEKEHRIILNPAFDLDQPSTKGYDYYSSFIDYFGMGKRRQTGDHGIEKSSPSVLILHLCHQMYLREKDLSGRKKEIMRHFQLKIDDVYKLMKDIIIIIRMNHYYCKSSYVLQINEANRPPSKNINGWIFFRPTSKINDQVIRSNIRPNIRPNISCGKATCLELIQNIGLRIEELINNLVNEDKYRYENYDSVVIAFFKKTLIFFQTLFGKFSEEFDDDDVVDNSMSTNQENMETRKRHVIDSYTDSEKYPIKKPRIECNLIQKSQNEPEEEIQKKSEEEIQQETEEKIRKERRKKIRIEPEVEVRKEPLENPPVIAPDPKMIKVKMLRMVNGKATVMTIVMDKDAFNKLPQILN